MIYCFYTKTAGDEEHKEPLNLWNSKMKYIYIYIYLYIYIYIYYIYVCVYIYTYRYRYIDRYIDIDR